MESLTYDRAVSYKDEFPEKEYETWQPKKVLAVLLEIDPTADKDSSIAFGIEDLPGVPAKEMHSLGIEKVLSMATIKKHYDALGSYLHMPTLKQQKLDIRLDLVKLRIRCEEISTYLGDVLSSPVFNSTFGRFGTVECSDCGEKFRKRIPFGKSSVLAICPKCKARYDINDQGGVKIEIRYQQTELACASPACGGKIYVGSHQIESGRGWACPDCQGYNRIALGISYEPSTLCDDEPQQSKKGGHCGE